MKFFEQSNLYYSTQMSKYSHFLAHYLTRERKKITQHLQLLSLRAPVECGQENKMSQKSLWGRIKKNFTLPGKRFGLCSVHTMFPTEEAQILA